MKLNILGTGTFFANINRTASSFLLEIGDKKALIDCGPGTLVRLSQIGLKPEDLDYVFITHFHPDHTSDLFPLFMNYRLSDLLFPGSVSKFPKFYGPQGFDKYMSEYSHNSELLAYDGWGKIEIIEYLPTVSIADFVVKTYAVDHNAFKHPAKAFSLRFEHNNKIIVFSGDCSDCTGIRNSCQDADIFVCDASMPKNKGGPAHMDTLDIGDIAQAGNVKKVILTHFYPQYDAVDLVSEVKEKYQGEVVKGEDLTSISL